MQVHNHQQQQQQQVASRGRQHQIPKRYEFQKNISRRTSSASSLSTQKQQSQSQLQHPQQQQPSILGNRIELNNERLDPKSPRVLTFRGESDLLVNRGGRIKRVESNGMLGLQRVKSTGSHNDNTKAKVGVVAPSLAQFKRHIADIHNNSTSNNNNINMYNENTVFETSIPGRRNYAFEQQILQQQQHNYRIGNIRQRTISYDSNNSNGGNGNLSQFGHVTNHLNNFDSNGSNVNTPRTFKSPFLYGYRKNDNIRQSTNSNRSIKSFKSTSTKKSTGSEKLKHDDYPDTDNRYDSSNSDYTSEMEDEEEGEEDDDYDDDMNVVNMDGDTTTSNKSGATNETDHDDDCDDDNEFYNGKFATTRTQRKQYIIKEGLEDGYNYNSHEKHGGNDADNEPIGEAWMDLSNYENTAKIVSNKNGNNQRTIYIHRERADNNNNTLGSGAGRIWMNSSLKQRNMYEHVTNELRKMVFFSERPLLESVARKRDVRGAGVAVQDGEGDVGGVAVAVAQLWREACREFSF